jgi:hypothetical protein
MDGEWIEKVSFFARYGEVVDVVTYSVISRPSNP